MKIKDNVFIVTGGASGLGAGTVRMLTEHGAKVIIADIQDEAGQELAKELDQRYLRCDVTSEQDAQAVVDAALHDSALLPLFHRTKPPLGSYTNGRYTPHAIALFQ